MKNKIVGNIGEKIASFYLQLKGYEIVHRNFLVKGGEIDIVALKDNVLVIVEVKTRRNSSYGDPKDAVGYNKRKNLIYAAKCYIKRYEKYGMAVRFDVVEIMPFKINHIKDAFFCDGL